MARSPATLRSSTGGSVRRASARWRGRSAQWRWGSRRWAPEGPAGHVGTVRSTEAVDPRSGLRKRPDLLQQAHHVGLPELLGDPSIGPAIEIQRPDLDLAAGRRNAEEAALMGPAHD